MATTERLCRKPNCQHGASAHKMRTYQYIPYRAECEFCQCKRYDDPLVTLAEIASGENSDSIKRSILDVPFPVPARAVARDVAQRRAYWRQKQRESRERRGL